MYLCHSYCELGATRAVDTFRVIDDYLRENPNEVIVLILEDYVDPVDAVEALKKSGLGRHALRWDPGEPLPTLREMIQGGRNVLVLVENEGGAEPWYVPAFKALEETPFRFDSRSDFSCEPNRGRAASRCSSSTTGSPSRPPIRSSRADVTGQRSCSTASRNARKSGTAGRTSSRSTSSGTATCSTSSPS